MKEKVKVSYVAGACKVSNLVQLDEDSLVLLWFRPDDVAVGSHVQVDH